MSCWVIYNEASGAIDQIVLDDPAESIAPGMAFKEFAELPDLSAWRWDAELLDFVPHIGPRYLTGLQILGLYTAAQTARANRMLTAVYPDGHPWAGQYVDPDGFTQRLINATTALKEPIPTTGSFHQQGTAWMRAIGVIESDEEAARIAAGITPEEAMGS
jgi:hypothetical protein